MGGRGASDRPAPVEIEIVRRGAVARTSTIAGMLEPLRTVGVNAQVAGILLKVNAEEGSRVRQGDTLAEIDVQELEAQARSAAAALRFAESTRDRSEKLFLESIITAAELERDRTAWESARATNDQLRTRLGYARVMAPISGVITEKRVEGGDIVGTQTRLFTIADVGTLVTRVQVSELEVTSLTVGETVRVTVDALGGERVDGRIRRIFPAADSATRLVPVEVALSGPQVARLRPGYTVRATFELDLRADALLVPSRAVSGPAGARAVYVITGGTIQRRQVQVGTDVGGMTEVFDGLQEGDSAIVSGTSLLREGSAARVVSPLGDVEPKGRMLDSAGRMPADSGRRGGRGA
jgi:RND family efflux transporter MFP subunit